MTNFSFILTNLRNAVIRKIAVPLVEIPFLRFIFNRIGRLSRRFERLFAHWQNGTLPKPRAPRPGRTRAEGAPRPGRTRAEGAARPAYRYPGNRAWLVTRYGYIIAAHGSQFRHWLETTPELTEFLAAAPQARRILNPLCRLLGATLPPEPEPPATTPMVCDATFSVPSRHLDALAPPAAEPPSRPAPPSTHQDL